MKKVFKIPMENPQYSQYLSYMLDELCISQPKLGEAVGRSQKTISRYVRGESMPDEKTMEAIEKYIQKQSVYYGFHHIPSEEFAQLLGSLLDEFKGRITQGQLAQKIGKYQKDISRYLYCAAKPDTEIQYHILNVFFELCQAKNGLLIGTYAETGSYLRDLLERDSFQDLFAYPANDLPNPASAGDWGDEELIDEKGAPEDFVKYCKTLPFELQQLIVENFEAFCDNYGYVVEEETTAFDFRELADTMDLFRQLSPIEQKIALIELEKDPFVRFPKNERERIFFRQITAYRKVISENPAGMRTKKDMTANPRQREQMLLSFERYYADLYWFGAESMMEELEYKLRMTQYEWYLWMLLLIYCFKGKNLARYHDSLLEIGHSFD